MSTETKQLQELQELQKYHFVKMNELRLINPEQARAHGVRFVEITDEILIKQVEVVKKDLKFKKK